MPAYLDRAAVIASSLRGRLALVALLSAAPLFALLMAGAIEDRSQGLEAARSQALDLARQGASQQDELVLEAANMVRTLGRVPSVANMIPGICHDVLRRLDDDHPRINGLAVARTDGRLMCSSRSEAPDGNVAERGYFQALMRASPPSYVVSEVLVNAKTLRPSIAVAAPLPTAEANDVPPGLVVAAVGLEWFGKLSRQSPGTPEHVVELLDSRNGMLLARSPPSASMNNQQQPSPQLLAAYLAARGEGTLEAPDVDGTPRVFGFAPLPGGQSDLVLAVGFDQAAVLMRANARLWRGATLALAAMVGAVLLAMASARRSLLRPVAALARAVGRLGAGDLSARVTASPGAAPELGALCIAFDRMAERLVERGERIAAIQAELTSSEIHHRVLAEASSDMITRFGPDFRRTYVSPACRELLGREPEELVGNAPGGIVYPDDWPMLDRTLNQPLLRGEHSSRATYRALHKDGSTVWLESIGRRLGNGDGFVVVTRDVSEQVKLEEQLREANQQLEALAMLDGLTGLANRRRLDTMLASELRRAQRVGAPVGLVMIDVDFFKRFNDEYGHPAGDECLRQVAKAIDGALRRPADCAARWGGEEFVALLPNTDAAGALMMAQRIVAAVRALDLPHAHGLAGQVTVSAGAAALATPAAKDAATLITAADAALYRAKDAGRGMARLSSPESVTSLRTA